MTDFLLHPRLIDRLEEAKRELRLRKQVVEASDLADAVGMGVVVVLIAIHLQKAWQRLGLDEELECMGPGVTAY